MRRFHRSAGHRRPGLPQTAGGPIVKSAADGSALAALRELHDSKPAAAPSGV